MQQPANLSSATDSPSLTTQTRRNTRSDPVTASSTNSPDSNARKYTRYGACPPSSGFGNTS